MLAYLSPYRLHFVPLLFVLSFTLLITLSQADDQFGGRVRSIPFQDGIIGRRMPMYLISHDLDFFDSEMGAQWIHGKAGDIVVVLTQF